MMPMTRIAGPMYGICENAAVVIWPPFSMVSMLMFGFFMMVETRTRPVIRQTTTVSQNVPVAETSA